MTNDSPQKDPRQREVTITMTVQEWDALGFTTMGERRGLRKYASEDPSLQGHARHRIADATLDGLRERWDIAEAEAKARFVEVGNGEAEIERAVREAIEWWETGDKSGVSPLGAGAPVGGGIPEAGLHLDILPGVPHLIFYRRPAFAFAGKYPYFLIETADAELIRSIVQRVRPIDATWNGDGTETMGVGFTPERTTE